MILTAVYFPHPILVRLEELKRKKILAKKNNKGK